MITIELFCGTKSFSKIANERNHETFTIDNNPDFNPDLCIDILDFDISMLPEKFRQPDVIWASPPCTTFSVASISRYWKDGKPKNEKALHGIALIKKTIEIIKQFNPKYWFIENPRGMLRKQDFMQSFHRKTLTYCQYGDSRQKPTDIWTNFRRWNPKPMCKPGGDCHDKQPRSYSAKKKAAVLGKGTQGLINAKLRAIIPSQLIEEILDNIEKPEENKMEIKELKLKDIKERETNPNRMNKTQLSALKASVEKYGQLRPLVIDQENNLVDGHQLKKVLEETGKDTASVLKLDLKNKSDVSLLSQILNKVRGKHDEDLDAAEFKRILEDSDMETLSSLTSISEQEILNILNKADEESKEVLKKEMDVEQKRTIECPFCKETITIDKKGG